VTVSPPSAPTARAVTVLALAFATSAQWPSGVMAIARGYAPLFVPDSSPAIEAGRFTKLLAEFRQHLPSKRAKLRALLAELEPLQILSSDLLTTGPASELARFPMLSWAGRKGYPADCTLAETFWSDLEQALRTRAEWATRAYNVVAVALGEAPKSEINNPAPTPQPFDTPAEDSCYCRTHPNVETLTDLPESCRIHEVISGALPEIKKQIADRKLADTSAGFQAYCEEKLAQHVEVVGEMAKNLAHPTLYSEAERPQILEIKLWNLTLCGLYKSELATLNINALTQPQSVIQSQPLNTATAFASLLLNYTLDDLIELVVNLELYDRATGRATPKASPGAWVGVIYALLDERRPRLKPNKAKARRAFCETFGAVVSESAVHTGLGKAGCEAELFKNKALALLSA
jgi:hypothetical protein